jgi:DNA-3-methyladenine glycosylase II
MVKLPFADPIIDSISSKYELPKLKLSTDLYLDLIENIISQQLSGKVAKAIFTRFCSIFPNNYPAANLVLKLPDEKLREAGLSGAKTQYVKAIAEFSLSNDLTVIKFSQLSDEEIISQLVKVKGIGVWTAQMLLIFSLNRQNVFPVDDLAIRIGMQNLYGIASQGVQLKKDMIAIAENWQPNRTIGTRYIWLHINNTKVKAERL